jgi:glycosyltransferase involved in cell wall biosynthesis
MVSVCIPTYNGGEYIKEQIYSILCQLNEDDEIVISDDESDDETIPFLESLNDPRIRIFHHKRIRSNHSGTYTRIYAVYRNVEHAIKMAKGDIVFLADQDDIWVSNKLTICIRYLQSFDLVFHDCIVCDAKLNVLYDSYFRISVPRINLSKMLTYPVFQGCCMAFSRKIISQILPFPNIPISHDHWIAYVCLCNNFRIKIAHDKLLFYRRHGANVSFCGTKSSNSIFYKVSYRFLLFYALLLSGLRRVFRKY